MIKNNKNFDRVLSEAVRKSIRQALNEYEDYPDDVPYGDSELDDDDYLNKTLRDNERAGFDGSNKPIKSNVSVEKTSGGDNDGGENKTTAFDLLNYILQIRADKRSMAANGEESDDDTVSGGDEKKSVAIDSKWEGNELFQNAVATLSEFGNASEFKDWFDSLDDEDIDKSNPTAREEAKKAFYAAKKYVESQYETDTAKDFSDRGGEESQSDSDSAIQKPVQQQHKAGNVIEYDGIEITDDGRQYTMIAKDSNPQITIKGSDLSEVEGMYDRLWNNFSTMEDVARKMGFTVWHGAYLWLNDYDEYVRSAGAHEENLPIIIDLDKVKNRGIKSKFTAPSQGQDSEQEEVSSWLEPFKHANGKYMLTPYQVSKLSDEQRAEWETLKKKYPNTYVAYSEAPSDKKKKK